MKLRYKNCAFTRSGLLLDTLTDKFDQRSSCKMFYYTRSYYMIAAKYYVAGSILRLFCVIIKTTKEIYNMTRYIISKNTRRKKIR